MTSIIHFTPISGAQDRSPPCYLLQIDEFRCLLDCGFDEAYDIDYVQHLRPFIGSIDAVFLSHPDTNHLGALPYLVGKCGLSCEVYATTPVYQMGQMFAYDLYQSRNNYEDFELFSLDDIDLAFEKVVQVKYNQTITLKGKGQGITVTPLPAGHMLGGTIWRITKDGGEDIIYATDFNHKTEQHLNGCDRAFSKINRPSLLITDCINVDHELGKRKERDEQLLRSIQETVRSGGNVLISLDTAGRALELSHLLEKMWADPKTGLQAYSLVLLNNFSYNVIEFAKSLVEWMSDKLMRQFEGQRNNPFAFRNLQLCHNLAELSRISEPAVILASQPDLECGFSRELFFTLSQNEKNTIILTQRCSPGTLADRLIKMTKGDERLVEVVRRARVPLTGRELDDFLEAKKQEALAKDRLKQERSKAEQAKDEDESEDSDDDFFDENDDRSLEGRLKRKSNHSESDGRSALPENKIKHDLMISSRSDGRVKGGGFFKNAKKSYPMFPCIERKMKWDEYGEIINPEDYAIFDVSRINLNGSEDKENKSEALTINGTEQPVVNQPDPLANLNPTKCTTATIDVEVLCRIEFIDFEGRSDGESLKRLVKMVKPRRLILVRGEDKKIASFKAFCTQVARIVTDERIFAPKVMEVVDATTERHIYQVKLRDALVSSLRFSTVEDGAQLAWVEAEIVMENPQSLMPAKEAKTEEAEEATEVNDASAAPASSALTCHPHGGHMTPVLQQLPLSRQKPHLTIFVNQLKLSDFKQILMKHGIQAEFSGGVLVCNGVVEVKRTETGRIHLEGTVCEDYFTVRKLLYSQYAIL